MFLRIKGFMKTPAYYITHRRSLPHLRVLEIAKCDFIKKLSWWLQAGNEPVDTLRLDIERRGDIPAYQALMCAVDWSLRELRIHFKNNVDLVDSAMAEIFGHDADTPRRQGTPHLPPIASPYLERISLDLGISSPEDLSGIDWHTIDQVFSRPNFSSLKLVMVKVRVEMSPMDWRERRERTQSWLAARLPCCRARGIFDSEAISA
ncbi:hypothetical protein PILCRDRAFT_454555 [Piloderma croceum F 1598]|uniref:F-box domain-containing protein n=1 Tax=Piloderma croceum (strain F 1598) TaxID=765440 RepID=A0A0C3FSS1_PILCF|nr:hypothetical protein PILCRDRAFT_454555 [Piloderma croceum F 1598]